MKVPEYDAEDRKLSVPNELNHSYCLRIETRAQNSRTWTVVEPCVTAENGVITLDRTDLTNVNVSICLVYRPEVCGEPVACKISTYMLLYYSLCFKQDQMFWGSFLSAHNTVLTAFILYPQLVKWVWGEFYWSQQAVNLKLNQTTHDPNDV